MGITSARAQYVTHDSATIIWTTDTDATTELNIGKVMADGSCSMQSKPDISAGIPGTSHSYPVSGLDSASVYRAEARSFDDMNGAYVTCDDGSSPLEFTTAAPPATAVFGITAVASKSSIRPGESCDITVTAVSSSGSACSGISVDFSVSGLLSWLLPRIPAPASVAPASAVTGATGTAKTVLTAKRPGIAVVKASSGSVLAKVAVRIF